MCGIAGILGWPTPTDARRRVELMLAWMAHRGPDHEAVHEDGPLVLGHRRLSIIDLSPGGHQPMGNEDKTVWVVTNGEIYNHLELREQLQAKGHRFTSRSDAEVLVHGYEEWGDSLPGKLNGMFAFAAWDGRRRKLLLARDPFGIKPLYYRIQESGLYFSSEIKPLLAVAGITPTVNEAALHDFLRWGLVDHERGTFFSDINCLPAGHLLSMEGEGPRTPTPYWKLDFNDDIIPPTANELSVLAGDFCRVFMEAVARQLASDVPLGFCLSGGLDSSALVCAARELLGAGGRLETFSSCFDEPRYDERRYIREVIKRTGAANHQVFPGSCGFVEELENLVLCQEQPFVSTSIYAQWCLMRKAKEEGITVLLDGQGGDELMGGYSKFYFFYLHQLMVQRRWGNLAGEILALAGNTGFLRGLHIREGLRYLGWGDRITGFADVLKEDFLRDHADRSSLLGPGGGLSQRIRLDLEALSLPSLLRYEDRNSMAFSREARVPFLDLELVKLIAALPHGARLRKGRTKFLVREAMAGILPEPVRTRTMKMGFVTPEEQWLRFALAPLVEETLQDGRFLDPYVDRFRMLELFRRYLRNPGLVPAAVIFRFFILERWAACMLGKDWSANPGGRGEKLVSGGGREGAG